MKISCNKKREVEEQRFLKDCPELPEEGNTIAEGTRLFLEDSGFTLVELIVVVAILGILAIMSVPAYDKFVKNVKVTSTIADLRVLEKDILAQAAETAVLPNSLADIGRDKLRDPWGNLYQYLNIANGGAPRQDTFFNDLNADFDIYSLGADGLTQQVVTDANALDDIVRAKEGGWIGLGENF